jgi:hypothetical protein
MTDARYMESAVIRGLEGTEYLMLEGTARIPLTHYLDPPVGTVSTPDPGPLPAQYTFVAALRGPIPATALGTVASQTDSTASIGGSSWKFTRYDNPPTRLRTAVYYDFNSQTTRYVSGPTPTGADEFVALGCIQNNGTNWVSTSYSSTDGMTWTTFATLSSALIGVINDIADPVVVGRSGSTGVPETFPGRIYYLELRTGNTPTGGSVVWRFDAAEYPGSGTSFVDPRGRTWTLTNASAIKAV